MPEVSRFFGHGGRHGLQRPRAAVVELPLEGAPGAPGDGKWLGPRAKVQATIGFFRLGNPNAMLDLGNDPEPVEKGDWTSAAPQESVE